MRAGESILVVGAGAIGGTIAGRLALHGHDVTVLDADVVKVTQLREAGLTLEAPSGVSDLVRLDAYAAPDQLTRRFSYAILTTKGTHVRTAVPPLVANRVADTYVALGNGLVHELIAGIVGAESLIVGVVEWGATNVALGHVLQTTEAPIVLGELDGVLRDRTRAIGRILGDVAAVVLAPDPFGQIWTKLLLNSTFSGLSAVSGLIYADIAGDEFGHDLALAVWREGYAVARAQGVSLVPIVGVDPADLAAPAGSPIAAAALDRLMATLGPTKASMLDDLERGMTTEVELINGAVVAAGARLGISTTLNTGIVEIVHDCEDGRQHPDRRHLRELSQR